jgi:hypothetical protein
MKTTSIAVLALISASALAQPIVVLKSTTNLNTRDIAPSDLTNLEARKVHINWGKVGRFFKGAAKIGASLLFKRDEDGNLYLVARDLIDDDGELLARDFDDGYLEARDTEDYLEARDFDDEYLEARDFDDEFLEARDFDDEYLEARDFDDEYLEARDFDDEYLEARDLEERSRFSELGHFGHALRHGGPARRIHIHGHAQQQQDNDNDRRDLEERSIFGMAGRIGGQIFHHAHRVHQAAGYIPHRQNNNNQRRDLIEESSLYDLD